MFSVQTTGNEESELDQHPDELRGGGEDTQNQQHKKIEYDQLYPDYSDPEVSLKTFLPASSHSVRCINAVKNP